MRPCAARRVYFERVFAKLSIVVVSCFRRRGNRKAGKGKRDEKQSAYRRSIGFCEQVLPGPLN